MNISIPEELKERMDAHPDPVNWSAVAARAFEREIRERGSRAAEHLEGGVRAAMKAGDRFGLKLFIDGVREHYPAHAEEVQEDLEPFFERATNREFLRKGVLDWRVEATWPIEDGQQLVSLISTMLFEYQERVIDPLLAQLLYEITLLRTFTIVGRDK